MNFSCDRCGRLYSIADEKVQGRSFRVKCRACEHVISVKGSAAGAAAPAALAPAAAPPAPAAARSPTPPPVAPRGPVAVRGVPPPIPAASPPRTPAAAIATMPARRAPEALSAAAPLPAAKPETSAADAELAWLSGSGGGPPATDRDDGTTPSSRGTGGAGRRRALVAGGAVAVAACAAAGLLLWPAPKKGPPRQPPIATATAPAPVPVPVLSPSPAAPVAAPADAVASAPAAPAPQAGGGRARGGFEPVAISSGGRGRRHKLELASKDRKLLDLLDRKADAVPSGAIERTSLDTGRAALDGASVEQALADNRAAFAACVTKALKADPRLKVDDRKATLMLTVQSTGVVSACWIAEADLERTALGRCLVAASRRVVFPAFQGEALDVEAPLALSAVR